MSGWPALETNAEKVCLVPSSMLKSPGEIPTEISLSTETCALPLLDADTTLVAVMRTVAGEGKSRGAL